ncbi:MAG TPA: hypothetical protein VFW45_12930 [Candidatus Polarisedimenticolia bacterium]|nr:hypothetical protein [Candidatus Polarisedimenticolia bacterium]
MAGKGNGDPLNRYLEMLGLKPGASLEQINTTYFTLIKKIGENPTEEEEARLVSLRHAYDRLRKSCAPAGKPPVAAPPSSRHAGEETPAGGKGNGDPQSRYLETLGLKPGASLEEINTTYFTLIKRFRENPTEEEEERLVALRNAYDRLRKGYIPAAKPSIATPKDRRMMVPALAILSFLLLGALVVLNYGTIKMKMTHYDNGSVLRLKSRTEPFGEIVGYEGSHHFPTGNPSPAYAIRLSGREETLWVSERVVVVGMARISSN